MEHLVLITFHDLHEIHQYYPTIELQGKITFYYADDDYIDLKMLKNYYSPVKILDNENNLQELYIGLKFHSVPYGKATCAFFNVFRSECRIHLANPIACRSYPFTFCQNGISLDFIGRCTPIPALNMTQNMSRVDQLHEAQKRRAEFKKEILNWDAFVPDSEKTVLNLIKFAIQN